MKPHEKRLVEELEQLKDRLQKLDQFIAGPIFQTLPKDEQSDLVIQSTLMHTLKEVLQRRVSRLNLSDYTI